MEPDAGTLRRTARVMRTGPRPDAMKPDIHGVRTHSNRDFMAFQLGPAAATLVTAMGWEHTSTRGAAGIRGDTRGRYRRCSVAIPAAARAR